MEKKFRVAVYDPEVFRKILTAFNETYKTDFIIEETDVLDGVPFVFLKCDSATLDHIFLLGSYFNGSPLHKEEERAWDELNRTLQLQQEARRKLPYWHTDF